MNCNLIVVWCFFYFVYFLLYGDGIYNIRYSKICLVKCDNFDLLKVVFIYIYLLYFNNIDINL